MILFSHPLVEMSLSASIQSQVFSFQALVNNAVQKKNKMSPLIAWTFLSSVRACGDMSKHTVKPSLMAVINWQVDWQLKCQRLSLHSAFTYKLGDISPRPSVGRTTNTHSDFSWLFSASYYHSLLLTSVGTQEHLLQQINTCQKYITNILCLLCIHFMMFKATVFWNTFKSWNCWLVSVCFFCSNEWTAFLKIAKIKIDTIFTSIY